MPDDFSTIISLEAVRQQRRDDGSCHLPNLPASFWEARPQLLQLRAYAHAVRLSPDALLYDCLTRSAAWVSVARSLLSLHEPSRFNLFALTVSNPGVSKSRKREHARQIVPVPNNIAGAVDGPPIGSGEGLVELFLGPDPDDKKRKIQTSFNVWVNVDEGSIFKSLGSRIGSTLDETLRSLFSGADVGNSNADPERKRWVKGGEYSFGLSVNITFESLKWLLDKAGHGTPQRFLFSAATDPTIPKKKPSPTPKPPIFKVNPAANITMEQAILDEVDEEIMLAARGELVLDEMDAHRVWIRCKVAGILCIWDGRTRVNAEDWYLAGQIVETSSRVLADAAKHVETLDFAKADELSAKAARKAEKCSLAVRNVQSKQQRFALRIARKVHANGSCPKRDLRNSFAADERNLFEEALSLAEAQSYVEELASGHWVPGSRKP